MEPQFSQNVGREFVRQYYTMFGSGPKYVHRFYGTKSLFVRDDVVTTGQESIEKQIETLNLKDCQTKIRAVDSHSTIGDGFVVQVVGEISINGGSFRHFVQTFVLAPQTTKKYYVHNDTFRYLDEFLSETHAGDHENVADGNEADQRPASSNMIKTFTVNGNSNGDEKCLDGDSYESREAITTVRNFNSNSSTTSFHSQQPICTDETSSWGPAPASGEGPPINHSSSEHFHDQLHSEQQQLTNFDTGNESHCGDNGRPNSVGKTNSGTPDEMEEQQSAENIKQQSTWASRVGSKTCVGGYTQQPGSFPTIQSTQPVFSGQASIANKGVPTTYAPDGFKVPMTVHTGNGVRPFEPSRAATSSNVAMPNVQRQGNMRGRMYDQNVSYDQQVFIGNLPTDVKDSELFDKLAPYGKILNVSIVAKSVAAPFAFITFESPESVVKLLETPNLNIFIRSNRITVEKKRTNDGRFQQNRNDSMNAAPPRVGGMNQRGNLVRMPYQRGGGNGGGGGGGPFSSRPSARTFSARSNAQIGNHYPGGGNTISK